MRRWLPYHLGGDFPKENNPLSAAALHSTHEVNHTPMMFSRAGVRLPAHQPVGGLFFELVIDAEAVPFASICWSMNGKVVRSWCHRSRPLNWRSVISQTRFAALQQCRYWYRIAEPLVFGESHLVKKNQRQ
jgi:hypothetical protein